MVAVLFIGDGLWLDAMLAAYLADEWDEVADVVWMEMTFGSCRKVYGAEDKIYLTVAVLFGARVPVVASFERYQ